MRPLDPLSWSTLASSWQLASLWDAAIVAAAAGYALGLLRLSRYGSAWSVWRAVSFYCGLLILGLAVNSGIAVYSTTFFFMHMVQHLMLIMVVPYLLIAGHPLTLWVQAAPEGKSERRQRILRSRAVGLLTNPVLVFVLYGLVLVATHLTPLMNVLIRPELHQVENVVYLLSGYLCFLPMLGFEPTRWQRFPIPLRLVLAMIGMIPDTGIGVVLMTSDHINFPAFAQWRPASDLSLFDDQRLGGAIMWVAGDGLMALALLVLAGVWTTTTGSETGLGAWLESARRSALAHTIDPAEQNGGSTDVDSDDQALARYNVMLAQLAGKDQSKKDSDRRTGD
jgi:cytochrome c oxidase assembly factor CtaG